MSVTGKGQAASSILHPPSLPLTQFLPRVFSQHFLWPRPHGVLGKRSLAEVHGSTPASCMSSGPCICRNWPLLSVSTSVKLASVTHCFSLTCSFWWELAADNLPAQHTVCFLMKDTDGEAQYRSTSQSCDWCVGLVGCGKEGAGRTALRR